MKDAVFDLSHEKVAVIGQGNVALDVARILLHDPHGSVLRSTDISEHALAILQKSRVREVHLIGRRGPAQASFTNKELREIINMEGVECYILPQGTYCGCRCFIILAQKHAYYFHTHGT